MLNLGRSQVEQEDSALLVAEPRLVDPAQAPQGRADQAAGVGRGDRQLDVPCRVVLRILGPVPVGVEHHDHGRGRQALPTHLLGRPRHVGGQRLGQLVKAFHGLPEAA